MKLTALSLRFRWLQLPGGLLLLLLQRTPAPLLRFLAQCESLVIDEAPVILRSGFALAAMGTYNSVAGATVFNVTATPTAAIPASGAAKTTFDVTEPGGTAVSVAVSVSGAPGNPKSYSVTGALPAGLSLTGGTGGYVNVVAPYKMTIGGTPTTAGSYPVRITAWDGLNGTGGNSAYITVNFTISGGVSAVAPSITTQPSSQTVTAGGSASFTVAASGNPAPTYQWQKGGANIAGATGATLTLGNVQSSDAGNYTAVATNSAGSATSNIATLTVQAAPPASTAPSITTQPASQTVTAGGSATFTVAASGNPAPTYQWQKAGAAIIGATGASLTLGNVQSSDAGNYTAVATNSAGSATSNIATLTVQAAPPASTAPSITTQPSNQTVTAGGSATFTVAASGNPAPTYQWQKGGANIAGATGATLTLGNVQSSDAGNYTAIATNSAGSATSNIATLTVQAAPPASTAPSITTQPSSQTVTAGGSATFTVAASGNPAPTYQWQKGGANIAGATGGTLTLGNVQSGDAGNYTAVATNSAGSATSNIASLTVQAAPPSSTAPSITTQPSSQTVTAGGSATFTVAASGNPAPTYQWQKAGAAIIGATGASLTFSNVQSGDAGDYTAVATNSAGSATSNIATLTVQSAPPASTAILPYPTGIVFAGTDRLYVTDATTNTVQEASTDGEVSLVAGSKGNAGMLDGSGDGALFNQPGGLAAASTGIIYVSDTANATIRRIDTDGRVTTLAGSSGQRGNADGSGTQATFSAPLGLALDRSGNLFVADSTNHTVRKITPLGAVSTLAGSAGQPGYANGTGPAARFNYPSGVAVDAAGNVFVADRTNNVIRRITPAGAVTTVAGTPGVSGVDDGAGSAALFNQPGGLALDGSGNLYVADTGNCTIRKMTAAGGVSTLAGLPTVGGDQDGTGMGAQFNQPRALTIDGAGNLYVADTGNSAVRKVTPGGVVTTLALKLEDEATPPVGGTGSASSSGSTGTGGTPPAPKPAEGSGGGGATSEWFLAGMGTLCLARWMQRRSRHRRAAAVCAVTRQDG